MQNFAPERTVTIVPPHHPQRLDSRRHFSHLLRIASGNKRKLCAHLKRDPERDDKKAATPQTLTPATKTPQNASSRRTKPRKKQSKRTQDWNCYPAVNWSFEGGGPPGCAARRVLLYSTGEWGWKLLFGFGKLVPDVEPVHAIAIRVSFRQPSGFDRLHKEHLHCVCHP